MCLHAAGLLSEAGSAYRKGLFAARGVARQLLQVSEICRLEHLEKDQRFLNELCQLFPSPPVGFFHADTCVLWKGLNLFLLFLLLLLISQNSKDMCNWALTETVAWWCARTA